MDKSSLRHLIKQRKRQYTEQQLSALSLAIYNKVLQHPRIRAARTILLYYSMPDEADTHALVDTLWRDGRTVLLPRVTGPTTMDLVVYTGADSLSEAGPFHILEPVGPAFTDYDVIDVAVVPGVAFTPDGRRLGHGRGYYDRLLPQLTRAYRLGLCFPFQLLDDLPTDENDVKMEEVIAGTSTGPTPSSR